MRYIELFGTGTEDLKKVISAALSKGGDFADIFFEHSVSNDLSLRDREVNMAGSSIDYGVGIRVLSGDKTGYAYTETTTLDEMLKAANSAAEIASSDTAQISMASFSEVHTGNFYPVADSWESHLISQKKEYLMKLNDIVFQKDARVVKVLAKLSDSADKVLYFNSLGESFSDYRPMASLVVTCIMENEGRVENFTSTRSFRMGFEFLTDVLIEVMADEAVSGCAKLFEATQPPCGEMQVVMATGSSGILLHEAIGHAFEADFNRKKISIFSEKMGHKICLPEINIVDDGTIVGNRGSINVDDEGTPSQKTYMVKDGILNSFLHDRISARFYGVPSTGNGRRESFRFMPIPRMRATYMENGTSHEEDMIKSVKKGIYVDSFSNGQVQIGAGDFTFFVKSGYMIEDGHLTAPIKDANIIGNGPQALADIIAVADNMKIDNGTWTCGKEQYCPVCCGMPSVLIRKLNVGGLN